MRNIGKDSDVWRVIWITHWKFELKMEHSTGIESAFRPSDVCMPCEQIILERPRSNSNCGYFLIVNFFKVFHEPLVGEGLQFFIDQGPI